MADKRLTKLCDACITGNDVVSSLVQLVECKKTERAGVNVTVVVGLTSLFVPHACNNVSV